MAQDDFHLGAQVYSSDGTEIGDLVHVLTKGDGYEIDAVVVKETRRFAGHELASELTTILDEFIVPRQAIKAASHDRVELSLNDSQIRRLPGYLRWREKGESALEEAEDEASILGSSPELPRWLEEVANKPADELEIDGGENVMLGHTGKKLGHVKDVLVDGTQLVGIVMQPQGFFRTEVIVPRRFLVRSDDAALFVNLTKDDLERLQQFKAE